MTAMPAIAQTLPGTYFPRLDTVQMRVAGSGASCSPQPESITRHAQTSTPYMTHTTSRASRMLPGRRSHATGCRLSRPHWRTISRAAKPTMAAASTHWATRQTRLLTERLAVPLLAAGRHLVGAQSATPTLPFGAGLAQPPVVAQEVERRIGQRGGRRDHPPARPAFGHHVEHAAAVPAGDHRDPEHERLGGGEPEALADGREVEQVRPAEEGGYLRGRHRADEAHPVRHPL